MADITRKSFKENTANLYADNVSGDISAGDLRYQMDNIVDSTVIKRESTSAPTVTDDATTTGAVVGDTWVNTSTGKTYECLDSTDGAAIWRERPLLDSSGDLTLTANVNIDGSITVTGTVDGRDVASDGTKLDTIETGADVTDAINVAAAGALMASSLPTVAYPDRETLLSQWVDDGTYDDGIVITDGKVSYVVETGSTQISDLNGLNPFIPGYGDCSIYHFGTNTTPGTTNMTPIIQAAIDWVAAYCFGGVVIVPNETLFCEDDDADGKMMIIRGSITFKGSNQFSSMISATSTTDILFYVGQTDPEIDGPIIYINFYDLWLEHTVLDFNTPPTSNRAIVYDRSCGTVENCHFRNWHRHIEAKGSPEGLRIQGCDLSSTGSFDLQDDTPGDSDASAHVALIGRRIKPGYFGGYNDIKEINYTNATGGTFTLGNSIAVSANTYGEIIRVQDNGDGTGIVSLATDTRDGRIRIGDTLVEYTDTISSNTAITPTFSSNTGVTADATLDTYGTISIDHDGIESGNTGIGFGRNYLAVDESNYVKVLQYRHIYDEDRIEIIGGEIDVEVTGTISIGDTLTEYVSVGPLADPTGISITVTEDPYLGGNYYVEPNSVYMSDLNMRAGPLRVMDHTKYTLLIECIDGLYLTNSHVAWGDTACIGILPRQENMSLTSIQISNTLIDPLPVGGRSLHGVYIKNQYRLSRAPTSDLFLTAGTTIAGCSSHGVYVDSPYTGMTFSDGASKGIGGAAFFFTGNPNGIQIDNWRCRNVGTADEDLYAALELDYCSRVSVNGFHVDACKSAIRIPAPVLGVSGPQDVSISNVVVSGNREAVINADAGADYYVVPNGHAATETNVISAEEFTAFASRPYLSHLYSKFTINGDGFINSIDNTCLFDGRNFSIIMGGSGTIVEANNLDLGGSDIDFVPGDVFEFIHSRSAVAATAKVTLVSRPVKTGTWTPVLTDGTNNAVALDAGGFYKIDGNIVTAVGYYELDDIASVSGALRLNGLPVAAGTKGGGGLATFGTSLAAAASDGVMCRVVQGTDYVSLSIWNSVNGTGVLTDTTFGAGGKIEFNVTYSL